MLRLAAGGLSALLLLGGTARAAEVDVVSSGGFAAAYKALAPEFEKTSGDKLVIAWGPSMGTTHDAVPVRLARGEHFDVLIMVGYALADLVKQGKVKPDSRVDLAASNIGIAVKEGAPRPDISTVAALKQTLLAAKSIAYSDSASGVYVQNELFKKLGIEEAVKGKARMIPAEPVGAVVARGEAEIGFQQIAEIKPVPGITVLGPLPADVQQTTIFSAGVPVDAPQPEEARKLIAFLSSSAAAAAISASGLDPLTK